MEFIKSWVTNITAVIIFIMLLDILMPNNDMKKFIKVIMGLLIILVLIKPILMVKNIGLQFESTLTQAAAYIEASPDSSNNSLEALQNNAALDLYKQKLSNKVIEIVKARKDLKNSNVRVSVDIENNIGIKEFGSIKAIQVYVEKKGSSTVQTSSIEPVKINTETVINKKQDEYNWNNSKLSQDLSADIIEVLGLSETKVLIEIRE